jgi:C_GCAxxG_C_C family probable redox protein
MNKLEKAVDCFNKGFNCAQAVLSAFAGNLGIDENQSLKVSSAFGGGICRMGDTCGAVTGGLMVIGLKYGMTDVSDAAAKEKTYSEAGKFIGEFKKLHGSVMCRDLLGYDLSKPEEVKAYKEKNPGPSLCPDYVGDAAAILENLLW